MILPPPAKPDPDSAVSGFFGERGRVASLGLMTKPNILRGLAPDTVLLLCYWWFFAGVSH